MNPVYKNRLRAILEAKFNIEGYDSIDLEMAEAFGFKCIEKDHIFLEGSIYLKLENVG